MDVAVKMLVIVLICIFWGSIFLISIFSMDISEWLKAKIEYQRKINASFDEIIQEGKKAIYDVFCDEVRKDLNEARERMYKDLKDLAERTLDK